MSLSGTQPFADRAALNQFLDGIRGLVQDGNTARALWLLRSAAKANGLDALYDSSEPALISTAITGWDELRRDAAEARDRAGGAAVMELRLVGRSQSSGDEEQGVINRSFFSDSEGQRRGLGSFESKAEAKLTGLEGLYAQLREPFNRPETFNREYRDGLCGWMIAASFVAAVRRQLEAEPLPSGLTLELGPHYTPRSMECGFIDLLPIFQTRIVPAVQLLENAASELLAERQHENRERFKQTWRNQFAEWREIHRLLGYFPFYRFRARATLADLWSSNLAMSCKIVGATPKQPISWRMSRAQLTALLHQIGQAKQVPDLEDLLDPAHTDTLHRRWVEIALARNFRFDDPLSMFAVMLAAGIKTGGPLVEDRWAHAKDYTVR